MGAAEPAGGNGAAGHLAAAEAARARGDVDGRRLALVAAFTEARAAGDAGAMASAALAMPTSQRFGAVPGQIPAFLFEAYDAAVDLPTRCRLAAALARSWVYGGDANRAARFADEAQRLAAGIEMPEITADALDASLLTHWGPDDFADRLKLSARLDEVAGHVSDTDLRLSAHLWRLTTAWECLDIVAVQRQLRALDVVADESGSPRAAFFAASRRAMYALAMDDIESAEHFIVRTADAGSELAEPDVDAVLGELRGMHSRMTGDLDVLRSVAAAAEMFGSSEGIPAVSALAAVLWLAAEDHERAALLVNQIASIGVEHICRDVDFLLTVSCVVDVATAVGLDHIARAGAVALEPYAGRGVVNAGAVTFYGVVDDHIARSLRATGDADAERWRQSAEGAYQRIGARWWNQTLGSSPAHRPSSARSIVLRRGDSGSWTVGYENNTFALADLRGLHYVRLLVERPGVDVRALALSNAVAGHPGTTVDQGDTGAMLDAAAVADYRRRLAALDAELDSADSRGDRRVAETATAERDALLDELRRATGLAGRVRRIGASTERARIAVRKAITATIAQIDRHDPSLARHLRDHIRTGTACRYDPNPDHHMTWITR